MFLAFRNRTIGTPHIALTSLSLRSSIKPALKRSLLLRGTLFASVGIAFLIYAGMAFSVQNLEFWGLPILGVSLALITAGLLPYKRMARLEVQPYELLLTSDQGIRFFQNRVLCCKLSWDNIARIVYVDHPRRYGIALWLKNQEQAEGKMIQKCRLRYGCDLFFPFFSKRSHLEMVDFYKPS